MLISVKMNFDKFFNNSLNGKFSSLYLLVFGADLNLSCYHVYHVANTLKSQIYHLILHYDLATTPPEVS